MKAVILEGANVFRVDEKLDPTPAANEALVRVRHTGICATDVAMIRGLSPLAVTPITPGHEWVGTIEYAPFDSGYVEGDWVTMYPTKGCGKCATCLDERPHHCNSFRVTGVHQDGGSFAEYLAVAIDQLILLPEALHNIHGALAEPATVGVHANLQGGMTVGKRVAIIGAGTIGSMIAQVARGWGAADIVMVDRMPARQELAADLGFDRFVLVGDGEEQENLLAYDGEFDVIFDNVCVEKTLNLAANSLKSGGTMVALAFPHEAQKLVVPYTTAYRRELRIVFSRNYARSDWDYTFDLMSKGEINTERMISGDYPLVEFISAMDDLRDYPEEHVKVIISP